MPPRELHAPAAVPEPTEAFGWLVRAGELLLTGDVSATLAAIDGGLGSVADDGPARVRASLLGARIAVLVDDGDLHAAQKWTSRRTEALDAAGRSYQARLEERLRLVLFGAADDVDTVVLVRELAAAQDARAHGALAHVALTLAYLDVRHGRAADALTHAETAVQSAAAAGADLVEIGERATTLRVELLVEAAQPGAALRLVDVLLAGGVRNRVRRAEMLRYRSRIRAATGDLARALDDAREALVLCREMQLGEREVDALLLVAQVLTDLGRGDDAIAALEEAARAADAVEDARRGSIRHRLGQRLLALGAFGEAAEALGEALRRAEQTGASASERGQTLWLLGQALAAADEPGASAVAWASALDLFEADEAWSGAAEASHRLGVLHLQHGHTDDAVAVLERGLSAVRRGAADADAYVYVLQALGRARAEAGDVTGLEDLDEAERLAHRAGRHWTVADLVDTRARALATLGAPGEALPVARSASRLYLEAGDVGAAGGALLFAGRLLRDDARTDDAVSAYRAAIELLGGSPEGLAVARAELDVALAELDGSPDRLTSR